MSVRGRTRQGGPDAAGPVTLALAVTAALAALTFGSAGTAISPRCPV